MEDDTPTPSSADTEKVSRGTSVERPAMLAPAEALEVPLQQALDAAAKRDKPARMSIAVELYDGRRYHRVPGLSWKLNYRSIEEAKALLAAVDQALAGQVTTDAEEAPDGE